MDIITKIAQAHTRHYLAIETVMADVVGAEHPQGSLLIEMCDYHLGTGGKRLRALLPVMLAEALGADPVLVYPFAAACEMLHNATLVHDDVQDGDTTRRGRPTVWSRYGEAQAINLGDAMYFYSLLALDRLDIEVQQRWQLAQLLLQSTTRVIDGQVREFQLQNLPAPTPADYIHMVQRKTSALFALPMVGSATLCQASPAVRAALAEAAEHLGIVFQLQDDLLDLFGNKGRNETGSDIAEGKVSALVVHSLELASEDDSTRLTDILSKPRQETTAADISWATALVEQCGAKSTALDEIRSREAAVSTLEGLAEVPAVHSLVTHLTRAFIDPISHLFTGKEVTP